MQHLAVSAIAVHRLCLQDGISIREEVLLLHVIEGNRFLRAHNGVSYAWLMHTGVMPTATLARVREYMLRLGGCSDLYP